MAAQRRVGAETSATRRLLLDITERLVLDEGYAAVSSRRVASLAGVNPALVHYYFPTMDDLFLAVYRRGAERSLNRAEVATQGPQPLRAMWAVSLESAGTAFQMEFTALANHRKAIQVEIAGYGERYRQMHLDAVTRIFADHGIDTDEISPMEMVLQMVALSQLVVVERSVGLTMGHDAAAAMIERILDRYEPAVTAPAGRAGPAEPGAPVGEG